MTKDILKRKDSKEIYRKMYCTNPKKWSSCKRYQVELKLGYCPDFVLPNSGYSIEAIVERAENQNILNGSSIMGL